MEINCKNSWNVLKIIKKNNFEILKTSSELYKRDYFVYDYCVIVPDDINIVDIDTKFNTFGDKRIHACHEIYVPYSTGNKCIFNLKIVKKSDFNDMIKENVPYIIDILYYNNKYKENFELKKDILTENLITLSNDLYELAHKKIQSKTEKDEGLKLLFNSLKLPIIGCQWLTEEYIDYSSTIVLWESLIDEFKSGKDWNFFNNKYKKIFDISIDEFLRVIDDIDKQVNNPIVEEPLFVDDTTNSDVEMSIVEDTVKPKKRRRKKKNG